MSAAAAASSSSSASTNKSCIGISWGADYGVVSIATVSAAPAEQQQQQPTKDLIKDPAVLANADGNRSTALFLNVANDEFLFGDGARTATLRFPQSSAHNIIKLLDCDNAVDAIAACSCAGKKVCNCGCPCMLPHSLLAGGVVDKIKALPMDAAIAPSLSEEQDGEEKTSSSSSPLLLDEFLSQQHRLGTSSKTAFDGDGAIVKTTRKASGAGEGEEEEVCLPATTWECTLQLLRMFRTIVRDSISGGESASSGGGSPTSSSSSEYRPAVVVLAVPRPHVDRNIVAALTRSAWRDWCSGGAAVAAAIHVVPKDVAALAAVLPAQSHLLPPASSSSNKKDQEEEQEEEGKAAEGQKNDNVLSLVVTWGSSTLTVSLFAHFARQSTTTLISSHSMESEIGGSYIDQAITKELLVSAQRKKLPPVGETSRGYRKFLAAAERAKIVLSSAATTSVEIESAVEGVDFVEAGFTRSRLEMILNSSTGARLQQKFSSVMAVVMADACRGKDRQKKAVLEAICGLGSSSPLPKFAVVVAGGTMRIPSLATFVKNTCAAELQKLIVFAAGGQQQTVTAAAWSQHQPQATGTSSVDPRELISVGACILAQTAAAASSSSSSLFRVGPSSSGNGIAPFEKQVNAIKRTKIDDIDDDDDDASGGGEEEEETVVITKRSAFAPQAAVLSSAVFVGSRQIIAAGTALPAKRPINFTGASGAVTFSLEVRKQQLPEEAGKAGKVFVLKFPVVLPENVSYCEVVVSAGGELTVVAGEELLRVEL